jgi:tetratricopeptide (TPR) repeat protein
MANAARFGTTRNRLAAALAVLGGLGVLLACLGWFRFREPSLESTVLAQYRETAGYPSLSLQYPPDGAVFPPESVPPTFLWRDEQPGADTWLVTLDLPGSPSRSGGLAASAAWTPDAAAWEAIKAASREQARTVTVLGFNRARPRQVLSRGRVSLLTSKDEVGAPLFYREVNLPFEEAVKDPSRIRWRFGAISSPQPPPVVLEHLPVCGNCHSFSRDGQVLGMDVDYANNKGSYVITRTAEEMVLATSDIMTWDDYKRADGEQTFGLLSQVSPDGKAVISTVKDRSVFVPKPDLAFSQLFFPIKGILAVYRRDTRTFAALKGADDPAYVQSNPTWSPDGKYIVFARAKAYQLTNTSASGKVLLTPEECREFLVDHKAFRFDLYRVPYNDGKGGTAEPVLGASEDGLSHYFPRYSPDGKWIVFCRAANYMLLQPDSELFIIPAQGGTPRRLRANTARMNSWHSWSPNGRWLVFSSKANSPYTQLFLTHMDTEGNSTPPIVLANLTAPDRAANIPEFVNLSPTAIRRVREQFLDDYSFERAGNECYRAGDADRAIPQYRKALELNPRNASAHQRLGFLLCFAKHQLEEGSAHSREALRLNPDQALARCDLGSALLQLGKPDEAIEHLTAALRYAIDSPEPQYQRAEIRFRLAQALLRRDQFAEGAAQLQEVLRLAPDHAQAHYLLAMALAAQGETAGPAQHYARALALKPQLDTSVNLHDLLSANYARAGRFEEAARSAQKALHLARAAGDQARARQIELRLQAYSQGKAP